MTLVEPSSRCWRRCLCFPPVVATTNSITEINYGVDMAEMGMPVVDPRFTVATLPDDSDEWLLFDDIGEF